MKEHGTNKIRTGSPCGSLFNRHVYPSLKLQVKTNKKRITVVYYLIVVYLWKGDGKDCELCTDLTGGFVPPALALPQKAITDNRWLQEEPKPWSALPFQFHTVCMHVFLAGVVPYMGRSQVQSRFNHIVTTTLPGKFHKCYVFYYWKNQPLKIRY